MKLVLVGGVKGVGKSSLLSGIENEFDGPVVLLDAGELFRQYHYRQKIKTTEEIEQLIVKKICSASADSTIIAHWHYAVARPDGMYIPQISFSRLEQVAKHPAVEHVILFLIEAPPETIQERRMQDMLEKKRALDIRSIQTEIAAEEKFWIKHVFLFSRTLRDGIVSMMRLPNISREDAKATFCAFVKMLVGP